MTNNTPEEPEEPEVKNIEYTEADDGFSLKVTTTNNEEFFIIIENDKFNNNEVTVQFDNLPDDVVRKLTLKIINEIGKSLSEEIDEN